MTEENRAKAASDNVGGGVPAGKSTIVSRKKDWRLTTGAFDSAAQGGPQPGLKLQPTLPLAHQVGRSPDRHFMLRQNHVSGSFNNMPEQQVSSEWLFGSPSRCRV